MCYNIFVISNGVDTKYFANGDQELNYGFTFYWTGVNNDRITNLEQFCVFFLERCQIGKMIARYMIINETEKMLMVMHPYQVYAVENIVSRALDTNNNGYVWHTTGSGKTITSFKTAQILSLEPSINQVFFLVDRKDLDKQTLDEFNKFDPGCVDMTNQTDKLIQQIKDSSRPLIITTIQKMANACTNPKYASDGTICTDYKKMKYVDYYLLDSFNLKTNQVGGTGLTHDWNKSGELIKQLDKPTFLAGGLNPDNVKIAIETARPYGVDVNSGCKNEHGKKDKENSCYNLLLMQKIYFN